MLPYTFQYGEPFTHTGLLATYKVSDKFTWGNGFVRGWDNFDNSGNPNLSYLGTATYTRDNEDTLAWVGLFGREPNLSGANGGLSTRYLQTLVYTRKFSENATGVLQSDLGVQGDATPNDSVARWYGLNGYLLWNQTCRLQWGLNGEWFRDEGGFRVGQALPTIGSPNARGYAQPVGFDGSFYRVMFGPKYFFTPNLYTRVAVAADWYEGKRNSLGNLPFDDGQRNHQELAVFDLGSTPLRAPLPSRASKLICMGRNFGKHAANAQAARAASGVKEQVPESSLRPKRPAGFLKLPDTVRGPGEPIIYPSRTRKLDYEVELALIIGKEGKDIPDRKSTRLNSSHVALSRMPSSA